jgi:maleate isomerase
MTEVQPLQTRIQFDERPVARRIGLVLLATDLTSERDFDRIVPGDEVATYCSRIAFHNPTTPENLRAMEPSLIEGAALILPDEPLDAICYSCTAASALLGDDAVTAALGKSKPGVPVVTPPLAARKAFAVLGTKRISLLTPYLDETAVPVARYFAGHGYEVARQTNLGIDDDRMIARVTTRSIIDIAEAAMDERSDALFISCTALRAAEVANVIEARIGRPVITSNQASAWMSLRLAGVTRSIPGFGQLLSLPLPGDAVVYA